MKSLSEAKKQENRAQLHRKFTENKELEAEILEKNTELEKN